MTNIMICKIINMKYVVKYMLFSCESISTNMYDLILSWCYFKDEHVFCILSNYFYAVLISFYWHISLIQCVSIFDRNMAKS